MHLIPTPSDHQRAKKCLRVRAAGALESGSEVVDTWLVGGATSCEVEYAGNLMPVAHRRRRQQVLMSVDVELFPHSNGVTVSVDILIPALFCDDIMS